MNGRLQVALAVVFALLVAAAVPGSVAAAAPPLNFDDDRTPNPYLYENKLTIAEHDVAQFDSLVEYFDDDGNAAELPAVVNQSQDEPFGFRADKVDNPSWQQFPRVDGESANDHTWLNASNWSTGGVNSSEMAVTDDDDTTASGVEAVECSSSGISTGDAGGHCEFNTEVNITSDVSKRVAQLVGQINTLGGEVEIRFVDSDGDYYYLVANSSVNANESYALANETGDGLVFQNKTNNLLSSGTVDEINKIRVNISDGDADVTLVGLDVESKSAFTLGETVHDFDGDGNDETKTIEEVYDGTNRPEGLINYTSLDSLGATFDDASIHDLDVYDVRYEMSQVTDESDWQVGFSDAPNYGSYPKKLEFHVRLDIPSQIDLTHGSVLEARDDQDLVDERFAVVEIAEDTGDTEFGNVSDSDYTSKSGDYTDKGGTITLDASVSANQNYIIHGVVLLQDDEVDALQQSSTAAAGPPGGGGGGGILGGIVDFVTTPFGFVSSLIASILAAPRILSRVMG